MASILVIEDEESIRENMLELLEVEQFEAIGAENGLVGVYLAKSRLPDLIICDIKMPELDGYGVLRALRQDPVTAKIPFIFLTAKAEQSKLYRSMEQAADDYLTKPSTTREILKAIATQLEKQAVGDRDCGSESKLKLSARCNFSQTTHL